MPSFSVAADAIRWQSARSGWFAQEARGQSASRRRLPPGKARLARGRSRRRFATGSFLSSEPRGQPRRMRGRSPGRGSTPRRSGTGATARSISSRTRRFLEPGREQEFRDRNVIVYGHAESNAAWPVLLGESPVQVRRGQVKVGPRSVSGDDLACLFIRPRPGSDDGFGGSRHRIGHDRPSAHRAAAVLHLGRGLPGLPGAQGQDACSKARERPIAAGYFGADWDVESGEFAWRRTEDQRRTHGR